MAGSLTINSIDSTDTLTMGDVKISTKLDVTNAEVVGFRMLDDAPVNGFAYARKDDNWIAVDVGEGSHTINLVAPSNPYPGDTWYDNIGGMWLWNGVWKSMNG